MRIDQIAGVWHIGLPTMTFAEASQAEPVAASTTAITEPTPEVAQNAPPVSPSPATTAPAQSPPTPAPTAPTSKTPHKRPACVAPVVSSSVTALWAEFAHLMGWSQQDKELAWSEAVLKRYNCVSGNELTEADYIEIEQQLARNIHNAYVQRGTPLASPFRPEFGDGLAA